MPSHVAFEMKDVLPGTAPPGNQVFALTLTVDQRWRVSAGGNQRHRRGHREARRKLCKRLIEGEDRVLARGDRNLSPTLNDKHGLVVDTIRFASLRSVFVLFNCISQDGVTNFFCRLIFVFTEYLFDLQPVVLIAAIVNPVRIKEEDISRTHERDFRYSG